MSFPLPVLVLPCQGDLNRLPSHCRTQPRPILHFLWSILESVREEKRMHASYTHTHTPSYTLFVLFSYICTHITHARKKQKTKENKVTRKNQMLSCPNQKGSVCG